MSGLNKVMIIGRLGQDPELKVLSNNNTVCNFSVATSESYTDKSGQKVDKTEWHRVIVYGKIAQICGEYLKKGRQVFIEGKLQTRSWDDQALGIKKYQTEIIAQTVQFLGANNETSAAPMSSRRSENSKQDLSDNPFSSDTSSQFDSFELTDQIPF